MSAVYVHGVGLAAPGLPDWAAAQPVLRMQAPYVSAPLPDYAPQLLPANERRRANPIVRLAFRVAEQALDASGFPAQELAAVFASSGGDTGVVNRICAALAREPRIVSPTDFHNSVHNAPAGYWAIATASRQPSSSLAAFDASFIAGLREAAALVLAEGWPVLLAAYDMAHPPPMDERRPIIAPAAVALMLSPQADGALARLALAAADAPETTLTEPALEALRQGNPAARALPLLQVLAQGRGGSVVLPGGDGPPLRVTVQAA